MGVCFPVLYAGSYGARPWQYAQQIERRVRQVDQTHLNAPRPGALAPGRGAHDGRALLDAVQAALGCDATPQGTGELRLRIACAPGMQISDDAVSARG